MPIHHHVDMESTRVRTALAVRHVVSDTEFFDTVATAIGPDGLELAALPAGLSGVRHVWLEFCLPGETEGLPLRPLGELIPRGARPCTVRFKHLFPDHRARLERFLQRQLTQTRAA